MTDLKQRPGDQPLPRRNTHPVIQDLVKADIEARRQLGIQRYGTALQPHNGRDALRDAYEEALDLTMYLRQALYERDNPDEALEAVYRWDEVTVWHVGVARIPISDSDGRRAVLVLEGDQSGQLARMLVDDQPEPHQPLTDDSCDVIPTQAGLDYLAIRKQQNPKAATDATRDV